MQQRNLNENEYLLDKRDINKQHVPISKQKPQIFIWKTVALVLCAAIAILLVINILMLLYLENAIQPEVNLTFINNIINETSLITTKEHINNLIYQISSSNKQIKFQYAALVIDGTGLDFSYRQILDKILGKGYNSLLYILELVQGNIVDEEKFIIGIYIPQSFKVPELNAVEQKDKLNKTLEYYTFQYGDDKLSTLFGLGSTLPENSDIYNTTTPAGAYLKMNGTGGENFSVLNCKTYRMLYDFRYLAFMEFFNVTLSSETSPASVKLRTGQDIKKSLQCFYRIHTIGDLENQLFQIFDEKVNFTSPQNITLSRFEIYELYNS